MVSLSCNESLHSEVSLWKVLGLNFFPILFAGGNIGALSQCSANTLRRQNGCRQCVGTVDTGTDTSIMTQPVGTSSHLAVNSKAAKHPMLTATTTFQMTELAVSHPREM